MNPLIDSLLIRFICLLLCVFVVCAGATQCKMSSHIGKLISFPSITKSGLVDGVGHPIGVFNLSIHNELCFWSFWSNPHRLFSPRINLLTDRYFVAWQKKVGVPILNRVQGDSWKIHVGVVQPNGLQFAARSHVSGAIPVVVHVDLKTGHSSGPSWNLFYVHNKPRPFRVSEGLGTQQCGVRRLFSEGGSGSSRFAGLGHLLFHQISLSPNPRKHEVVDKHIHDCDVYDDPFRSGKAWQRFLWGSAFILLGFGFVHVGERWVYYHMRWRGRTVCLTGLVAGSIGASLLVFGHAWPPKQEPCDHKVAEKQFWHDGKNVTRSGGAL